MKQSLKANKTILNSPGYFNDFIRIDYTETCMIAHCNTLYNRNNISEVYSRNENALILIGPEGDFSEQEIIAATDIGFNAIHLGQSRLRTETAGITACHSIHFINL